MATDGSGNMNLYAITYGCDACDTGYLAAATLVGADKSCTQASTSKWPHVWLGSGKTLAECAALCPVRGFFHNGGGDGDCRCSEAVSEGCDLADEQGTNYYVGICVADPCK